MRAWSLGIGGLCVMTLIAGCGSSPVAGPVRQTVTAVTTVVSTAAVTDVSTASGAESVTVTETAVETMTETMTETETETETETATASQVAVDTSPALPDSETTSPPPSAPAKVKPQTLTGSGDDVVKISAVDTVAILTFDCPDCTGNVVLETDGSEGLLVNTIGSYSGSHLINVRDSSVTSQLTITAEGSWTVSIADATTASKALSGKGDTALLINGTTTAAHITNSGEGNFVIEVYSSEGSDLAVNEIGSYSGTVSLTAPALVQVTSEGNWSIAPK